MRKLAVVLILPLILCAGVRADFTAPKQTITGAEQPVPLGELVDLSVSAIKDRPPELQTAAYDWTVLEPDGKGGLRERKYKQQGDGVFFGAGLKPRKLFVLCQATYLFVEKDKDAVKRVSVKSVRLTAVVTVGDGEPEPDNPTPPPPPPDPDAPLPAGKFGLAKFAYEAARGKVNSGTRAKAARALAEAFRETASQVAAGGLSGDKDILQKTKERNDAALSAVSGTAQAEWEEFAAALQDKLYELYKAGALKGNAAYVTAWQELATGLEKVK